VTADSAKALAAIDRSSAMIGSAMIGQEFLPGPEYSIDVLADATGNVLAAVPRARIRVDSGVSVAGRTVHDPELEDFGRQVALATGLTYVANVQCKRDHAVLPGAARGKPARSRDARADHRERRLRTLCLVDHVRADTAWVPEFVTAVAQYRSVAGTQVMAGVEAKILDTAGLLDVPPSLDLTDGIDLVLIADHQFPATKARFTRPRCGRQSRTAI
jgi:hypothetical protein